jgi:ferritin
MMISRKMADRLNEQVKNEFYSFWLYQSMSFALDAMSHKGFSAWYTAQAEEERMHAMKICQYLLDQGADVKLQAIDAPEHKFASVLVVTEASLAHEKLITGQINDIATLAMAENDHATRKFIDWLVEEQVEEVATATDLMETVKRCENEGQLMMVENQLKRPSASA